MNEISIDSAIPSQLDAVFEFLQPFFNEQNLLLRSRDELETLFKFGFVATKESAVVGFAAVEIYSKKLAEIQCLAVNPACRRQGIASLLVEKCVAVARQQGVLELMAISSAESLFQRCGFDYSLPNQKKALFINPQGPPQTDGE